MVDLKDRPSTRRSGVQGGRRRLLTASATLSAHDILGGHIAVSTLVANGTFTLPAVTGATGLVAVGGLQNGDRVKFVLRNNSVAAAGTATLAQDAGATITMQGPLVCPSGGASLHVEIMLDTAATAICYTRVVGASGVVEAGPNLLSYVDLYQSAATGSTTMQGTYATNAGAFAVTAAQLISGFTNTGAAGGAVALTLPGADAVQTALAAKGITSAAGLRLPPMVIEVTDANALTVTAAAAANETVHGGAINNTTAVVHYVFTGAATADVFVVLGS